jgi:hypothetical protein
MLACQSYQSIRKMFPSDRCIDSYYYASVLVDDARLPNLLHLQCYLNWKFTKATWNPFPNTTNCYDRFARRFVYLTSSRLGICHAIHKPSQCLSLYYRQMYVWNSCKSALFKNAVHQSKSSQPYHIVIFFREAEYSSMFSTALLHVRFNG